MTNLSFDVGVGGVIMFFAGMAMVVVTILAYVSILHKAGYSAVWLLVPVAQFILMIALSATLASAAPGQSIGFALDGLGILFAVEVLFTLVDFSLFCVFAFSTWPIERELERLRRRRSSGYEVPTPFFDAGPGGPVTRFSPVDPSVGGSTAIAVAEPLTAVEEPPAPPRSFFCSWCGLERSPGTLEVHHCGSRQRPPAYCSSCGAGLEGGEFCGQCGTPGSQLSPR